MRHMFSVEIANIYGVNCAIILENLYFWIEKNRANGQNFHDGYYWTYNSVSAFRELFPYMGDKQIRNALKKLKDDGIIVTGNYNTNRYDQTKWYAITEKGMGLFALQQNPFAQRANEDDRKGEPIPYNKPDNKQTDNKQERKGFLQEEELNTQQRTVEPMRNTLKKKIEKIVKEKGYQDTDYLVKRVLTTWHTYCRLYKEKTGKDHPMLSERCLEQLVSIVYERLSLLPVGELIEEHFKTDYGMEIDWNIMHFISKGILDKLEARIM